MRRPVTACRRGALILPALLSGLLAFGPALAQELPPSEPAPSPAGPAAGIEQRSVVPLRPPRRSALTGGRRLAAPVEAPGPIAAGRSGPVPRLGARPQPAALGPEQQQQQQQQQQKIAVAEPETAQPEVQAAEGGGVTIALPNESEMEVVTLLPAQSAPRSVPPRPSRRSRLRGPLEPEAASGTSPDVDLPSILDGLADAAVEPAGVLEEVEVGPLPTIAESLAERAPSRFAPQSAAPAGPVTEAPTEQAAASEDRPRDRIGVEVQQLPALTALAEDEPSRIQTARRPEAPDAVPERAAPPSEQSSLSIRDILRERMDGDTVVARVNGEEIRWSAIVESSATLPAEFTQRIEHVFPALLQRMIDVTLLAQAGRELGLQDRADIKRRVKVYEDNLIRQAMVDRMLEDVVSDEALAQVYDAEIVRAESSLKVQARHIVVSSEASAREIVRALDGGADFAQLARQRSMGPSARRGGDLGTFRLDRMPPAFAAAVRPLQAGVYTREPVQTEFGWHVILLEQRFDKRLPSFEETKAQLSRALARQAIDGMLEQLRANARIEFMPEVSDQAESESDSDAGASDEAVLGKIR